MKLISWHLCSLFSFVSLAPSHSHLFPDCQLPMNRAWWLPTALSTASPLLSCQRRMFVTPTRALLSPALTFDISALPPPLQREFDAEGNVAALRYLARRMRGGAEGSSVVVMPNWAHKVTWKCGACGGTWSARPVDRTDPQVRDHFTCPHCAAVRDDPHPSNKRSDGKATASSEGRQQDALCEAQQHQQQRQRGLPSPSSSASPQLLVEAYPTIAAQWDLKRNVHFHNRVVVPLRSVSTSSSAKVWWSCSLCRKPWQESVSSRVARHEGLLSARCAGSESAAAKEDPKTFLSLCPSCERRGALDRLNPRRPPRSGGGGQAVKAAPQPAPSVKQFLQCDDLLMAEVRLRSDQDPSSISLHSETVLLWHCRYCGHDFQASVAGRYDRHERCPQCSGAVQTPLNLLVLQRPDVVREVSTAISRTTLRHLTIFDDTTEIPFVCRTCLSPYRMTAKTRCAVPAGGIACPKCLLTLSQNIAAAPQPSAAAAAAELAARPRVPGGGALRSRREQRKIRRAAHRLSLSGQSGEHREAAKNDLRKRDKLLRN